MYDYITPQKLLDALSFLKANNPLYADIDVNQEWLEAAVANDAELCECLVEQQNDIDQQPNTDNTVEPIVDSPTDIAMDCSDIDHVGPTVDPQAAVANVASPPEIAVECSDCNDPLLSAMHRLETIASQNGFTIHDVPADGDCMFSAIVYQLNSIGIHVDCVCRLQWRRKEHWIPHHHSQVHKRSQSQTHHFLQRQSLHHPRMPLYML